MYPHLPTILAALSALALALAHPASTIDRRGSTPGLYLTAKDPTDTTCVGPDNGNKIYLGHGGCVIYQPAKGSNIYVDFGDDVLWESQIEIFSDTACETSVLTLAPTADMIANGTETMCSAMNADWPAWQSAKRGKLIYDFTGSGGLKRE